MNQIELVEFRLQALERSVRRYRLAAVLLGVGLIGLAGIAANAPVAVTQEIRVHSLLVLDANGKEVARLFGGPHGGVLDILSKDGFPAVRAGASEKGGKLALADAKGQDYVVATAEETGGALLITDKKGQKSLMTPGPARQEK